MNGGFCLPANNYKTTHLTQNKVTDLLRVGVLTPDFRNLMRNLYFILVKSGGGNKVFQLFPFVFGLHVQSGANRFSSNYQPASTSLSAPQGDIKYLGLFV